jgi:hypothetical protein
LTESDLSFLNQSDHEERKNMFKFLKPKRPKSTAPPSVAPVSITPSGISQNSNIKRELVRVVLKDTLRFNGIPSGWLACEVSTVTRSPGKEELHIELIVMQWNEQLLRYAPVLQKQLLLGLDRFDPSVDHSRSIVSWRFAPDCGCPYARMPDPKSWRQVAVSPVQDEPVPVLDRRHTRRPPKSPLENPSPCAPQGRQASFSPTQIAPLR